MGATNGRPVYIPRISRALDALREPRLSRERSERAIASDYRTFALTERFDGSTRAFSSHTIATATRNASSASTLMSPSARRPKTRCGGGKPSLPRHRGSAHIGSWSWDAATTDLCGSDELLRIYGWDATQPIPDGCEQRARNYPREDWERLREATHATMQTGTGYLLDLRAFRNGIPIWVTIRGKAVRNAQGQIVGLRGTVQDITERKTAELALAERNLQLALAGKAGLVGSFAYDLDTERMQISEGYAAIHGFPDGTTEIARSEWRLGVHPEDRVRWEALRSRAYRERWDEYSGEYRIVRPGSEISLDRGACFRFVRRRWPPATRSGRRH